MKTETPPMKSDLTQIRVLVDRRTLSILERWATSERRSRQMHDGLLLRRITELYEKKPEPLRQLGFISPLAIETPAA